VTISPPIPNDPFNYSEMTGLAPSPIIWHFNGSAGQVSVLGGLGNDIFSLHGPIPDVAPSIVGGSGINTLDYSSYTTGVTVNLAAGTATDLAGIANIQNVIGGSGNDTLIAGADRSILIGGGGADTLVGGSGEDILIGGTTDYTQPGNLNAAALEVIFQEWNRTDLGFDDRRSDLLTGSNASGVPAKNVIGGTPILLDGNTVHDDLAANVLTGGIGLDWYFIGINDFISNRKPGDAVTIL
jgi:Ca2+-binding RTX toxin-like protein